MGRPRIGEGLVADRRKTSRRVMRVHRTCEGCQTEMIGFASRVRKKFCSVDCMRRHTRIELTCPACKKQFLLARSIVVYRENRGKSRQDICCSLACSWAGEHDRGVQFRITGRPMKPRTDPQRCNGRCGREMPLAEYPKDAKGNPMLRCRQCIQPRPDQKRRAHLMAHFGITLEQWEAMYVEQSGRCPICTKDLPPLENMNKATSRDTRWRDRDWNTDHCHKTGKVRGILCRACNHALGALRDDPAIALGAAAYLERHRPVIDPTLR